MPNVPELPFPKANIGALADASVPPQQTSTFKSILIVAAVGLGAYMFGRSKGKEAAVESGGKRNDLIPGTSITVGGDRVDVTTRFSQAPTAKMGPTAKVGGKRPAKKDVSIMVSAPPETLRSGIAPSVEYDFDDFEDFNQPTRRF
jgi:hypothetical protein